MPGAPAQKPSAIVWIQYLRGVAALMVVLYHARNEVPWLYNPMAGVHFGAAGVDIFFVISGFIMFTAAPDEPILQFYIRRIIRIVPLYWFATAIMATNDLADGNLTLSALVKSLLFIPYANPTANGAVWPILVPGWTLNYEMFFYFLFGLSLLTRKPAWVLTMAICGLVGLGAAGWSYGAIGQTYTSALLLEFLAGVWLGVAYARFDFRALAPLLPVGLAILVGSDWLAWPKLFEVMIPATAIVAGALGLEARGWGRTNRLWLRIGDASYSIYIFHTIIIAAILRLYQHLPITGIAQFAGLLIVTMIASVGSGLVIHKVIEKPMTAAINRRVAQRRAIAVAA